MDDLNLSMFRAYDIRTPSDRLTLPLAERLARAEASYFREVLGVRGVVVAHDARRTGPLSDGGRRDLSQGRAGSHRLAGSLLDLLLLLRGDVSSRACGRDVWRIAQPGR